MKTECPDCGGAAFGELLGGLELRADARGSNQSSCHIIFDRARPHWCFIILRSAHLNIPNDVKLWHKAAPVLITVATILGLIVIFQH
jgi:hypothetical protein